MKDELFDIVNERNEVIGQKPRRQVHRDGDRHRAAHLLVFNSRGQVLLQKRSLAKDTFPGVWDSSASGHVDAGESYDVAVVREAMEEIGLKLDSTPEFLFAIDACEETGREFVRVYRCQSGGPFTSDPGEVERVEWFSPAAVDEWAARSPADFARAFLHIWERVEK